MVIQDCALCGGGEQDHRAVRCRGTVSRLQPAVSDALPLEARTQDVGFILCETCFRHAQAGGFDVLARVRSVRRRSE